MVDRPGARGARRSHARGHRHRASTPSATSAIVPLPEKIVAGRPRLDAERHHHRHRARDATSASRSATSCASCRAPASGATLTITGIVDLGNKGANQRNTYVALRTAQSAARPDRRRLQHRRDGARHLRRRGRRAGDRRGDRRRGRQLDQDQRAVLHRDQRADRRQHAASGSSSAWPSRSASPRVLVVSVVQKSKEIGILRAMGASRGQILRVFLLQGGVARARRLAGRLGARRGRDRALARRSRRTRTARRSSRSSSTRASSSAPRVARDADRRRRGAGARRCAARGSIRWWRSVADDVLTRSTASASPTTSARRSETEVLHGIDLVLGGRVLRADGAVGLRQEHAAQRDRPARPADRRPAVHRRAGDRPRSTIGP